MIYLSTGNDRGKYVDPHDVSHIEPRLFLPGSVIHLKSGGAVKTPVEPWIVQRDVQRALMRTP